MNKFQIAVCNVMIKSMFFSDVVNIEIAES